MGEVPGYNRSGARLFSSLAYESLGGRDLRPLKHAALYGSHPARRCYVLLIGIFDLVPFRVFSEIDVVILSLV